MAFADWARIERLSANGEAEIGARRIYILPTRYGLIFAILLFLMLIGAVNYGNNPAHLLTFLLAGLGSNAIYLTWRNLRGLRLSCIGGGPVFAGDDAAFTLRLSAGDQERPAVQFAFGKGPATLVDVPAGGALNVTLNLGPLPRGLHPAGRLTISTPYPLGLLRAWCYVDCDRPLLVYPRPGVRWDTAGDGVEAADGGDSGSGSEDFAGLRGYRAGDPPSQIDWKSFARDRGLNTRLFAGDSSVPLWLVWDQAPGNDVEARLSALTRAVLDAEAQRRAYGLRLPGATIAPGNGPAHRHCCLRALALFGLDRG